MADRSRLALVALLAAVGLLLTGCVEVPTSGRAQSVPRDTGDGAVQQPSDVQLLPPAPVPGQNQRAVLNGFLLASASVADNHAAARKFLTAAANKAWDADSGVTVYDSSGVDLSAQSLPAADPAKSARLRLTLIQVAQIDVDGTYQLIAPPEEGAPGVGGASVQRALDFSLVKVGEQWRLDQVPAGTLLSAGTLSRVYQPYQVYMVNRPQSALVPLQVFLPARSDLATVLVRRVLAGPPPRLNGVATTAGAGVQLEGAVVPGADQLAIPLSASAASLDGASRRLLAAQLAYTLRQLPSVSTLRLLAGGQPLRIPDAGLSVGAEQLAKLDPGSAGTAVTGYFVAPGGALVDLSSRQIGGIARLEHPAVRPDGQLVAGLAAAKDGTAQLLTVQPGKPGVVRTTGTSFTAPSFGGGTDGVWTYRDAASGAGALIVREDGSVTPVPLTTLLGGSVAGVTVLRVSRDSARVALVAGPPGKGQLYVGSVVGEPGGLAVRNLQPVAPSLVDVDDVTWDSRSSLVVLGRQKDGPVSSVWQVSYDGSGGVQPVTVNGAIAESVAAAPGQPLLIEATKQVWRVVDGTAEAIADGSDPVYPG